MVVGYARVSTKDQNLDLQIDALTKAGCEEIFQEKKSGKSKDRPELANLLKHLRAGDILLVYKLDRLGRSLKHLVEIVNILKTKKVTFESLQDGIKLNDTAVGQMMFNIFASFSQFEADLISERTRAGLAAARARGRIGGRPRGLSKEARNTAAAAKTLYLEGVLSIRQICKQLSIAPGTLYSYLRYMEVKVGSKCTRT